MGNSSHKHNILLALFASLFPLLIPAGILALCRKAAMPPIWFFLLQWIFFALMLFLIQRKRKEQPAPLPAVIQNVTKEKTEEPKKEAEEIYSEGEPANTRPAPFIPPMHQAQETETKPAEEPSPPEEKKETPWTSAALIDDTIIKRHIILGEEFVRKLFDIFVEDSPARLEEMQKALKQNMFENLRHAAHALKGSAAAIGARRLSEICLKIQKDCDGKTFEKLPELLKEAGEIFKATRTAVEKYDFSKLEN